MDTEAEGDSYGVLYCLLMSYVNEWRLLMFSVHFLVVLQWCLPFLNTDQCILAHPLSKLRLSEHSEILRSIVCFWIFRAQNAKNMWLIKYWLNKSFNQKKKCRKVTNTVEVLLFLHFAHELESRASGPVNWHWCHSVLHLSTVILSLITQHYEHRLSLRNTCLGDNQLQFILHDSPSLIIWGQ